MEDVSYDERIIVALDVTDREAAETLLQSFGEIKPYVKVGMPLFYATGPEWIHQLKALGYAVFLDLKLHDIPQTVYHAAQSLARLEVDLMTVHAAGGEEMLGAAVAGIDSVQSRRMTKVVGVTVLTSTEQRMLNDEIGISGTVEDCVLRYAELGRKAGLDGVVSSGWETAKIKKRFGHDFLAVTPGIRLSGDPRGDQKRVMTPLEAIHRGADYLVVGRSITQAERPVEAYRKIRGMLPEKGKDE